ncbi:MAG: hypothetical protein ACI4P0_02305 [Mailhella sp.]
MSFPSEKKSAGKRAAELFHAAGGAKKPEGNVVLRLLHGGFSPTVTFWIFCISIPVLGHLLFSRVAFPFIDMQDWHGSTAFALWVLLSALYGTVATMGLWRSRKRFPRTNVWSRYAGLLSLLCAAGFFLYTVFAGASWFMLLSQ